MSESHPIAVDLFITGLGRGGAETQLVRLACGLSERGWDVRVLTLLAPTQFTDVLRQAGVKVWTAGVRHAWDIPRAFQALTAEFRHRSPRVLLCFMFHADLLGRIAAWRAGVPVVVSSVRSIDMGGRHREWLLKVTGGLSQAVTANSAMTIRHLAEQGVASEDRLHVVPNGIDVSAFQRTGEDAAAMRSEMGAAPDDFVWLAIGRFEPPKDYPNLLRAFARVTAARSEARLWIAGEGPLREEMEAFAAQLGISATSRFLGLQDDIPQLLAGANAVVQASAWEGLPNSVLEGMAAGCPVVATDVGGTRELVESEAFGLLVPSQDPDALGHAMEQLMALPPSQRADMGAEGKRRIAERYTVEHVVDEWEALFLSLLEEAERPPVAPPADEESHA